MNHPKHNLLSAAYLYYYATEVAFEEGELLLLLLAVRASKDRVVLLTCGVERDLQLDNTLAAVLQVAHKDFLTPSKSASWTPIA